MQAVLFLLDKNQSIIGEAQVECDRIPLEDETIWMGNIEEFSSGLEMLKEKYGKHPLHEAGRVLYIDNIIEYGKIIPRIHIAHPHFSYE